MEEPDASTPMPEEEDTTARGGSWLPLALAVLLAVAGLGVGVWGLREARATEERLSALEARLRAEGSSAEKFGSEVSALSARIDALVDQNETVRKQVRSLAEQTQGVFDRMGERLQETARQVDANTGHIEELASRAPTARARAEVPASGPQPVAAEGEGGTYAVQPGDTLGRIARDHGLTLDELLAANPGIEPRRLQIGQVLQLPANARP